MYQALNEHFEDISGNLCAQGRRAIHGEISTPVKIFLSVANMLGIRPDLGAPNIELPLRKV
jgi:hypothetical protein